MAVKPHSNRLKTLCFILTWPVRIFRMHVSNCAPVHRLYVFPVCNLQYFEQVQYLLLQVYNNFGSVLQHNHQKKGTTTTKINLTMKHQQKRQCYNSANNAAKTVFVKT